tara:strand:- start:295 stop:474 length:180 start_codon:yes stop_codon:yes gene_type:complete
MRHYYLLSRVYVSNKIYSINKKYLDTTWQRLSEDRRKLRFYESQKLESCKKAKAFKNKI